MQDWLPAWVPAPTPTPAPASQIIPHLFHGSVCGGADNFAQGKHLQLGCSRAEQAGVGMDWGQSGSKGGSESGI